jgi:isorenieratene synthase
MSWLKTLIRKRFGGYMHALQPIDSSLPSKWQGQDPPPRVAVIGAGLAGMGAACDLSERGLSVTLMERNPYLGGKVGAWTETADDGSELEVEHGFHAFFRHYYNLNALLDRTGVRPHMRAIEDYLILEHDGTPWSFKDVETTPVLNLIALCRRGLYRVRDILFTRALHEMDVFLSYDRETIFAELDAVSYREFAERAELPPKLRLVFNTFARAFFADDDRLSMAELIKSFHFYYLSHDHGLIYEYPAGDYQQTVLRPFRAYMEARGVEIRLGHTCSTLQVDARGGLQVDGESFDHVVLATTSQGARGIVEASPTLREAAPETSERLLAQRSSQRYAVLRLWIDRDVREGLPVFVSTQRRQVLDSVTFYHRITDAGRRHHLASGGGAVLELHCYAVPDDLDDAAVARSLEQELLHYFPELRGFRARHQVLQVRDDFTAFHIGMAATRPETATEVPGLHLAGDWVKLPCPAMLMEAAATSSLLATNAVLAAHGLRPYPVWTVPTRGLLPRRPGKRAAAAALPAQTTQHARPWPGYNQKDR